MTSLFISYRREDSAGHTGRLHDRLSANLGADRIFLDIDGIDPGDDFVDVIDRTLDQCAMLLVMIGPHWLSQQTDGRRRIDSDGDFHRMEIERALKRKVTVLPILVGGAQMPTTVELPRSIAALARRNAFELTDKRFSYDADNLIAFIERVLRTRPSEAQEIESHVTVDLASPPAPEKPSVIEEVDKLSPEIVVSEAVPDLSLQGATTTAPTEEESMGMNVPAWIVAGLGTISLVFALIASSDEKLGYGIPFFGLSTICAVVLWLALRGKKRDA